MSSTTCWRDPRRVRACRTSASASATSEWSCTSSPRSRPAAFSATPRGRRCCSTTSHCRGHGGAKSSPPRCRPRSSGSRNAPQAPTAARAETRSAAAWARSSRCTDSAATDQQNTQPAARRAGHRPPGQRVDRPTRAQAAGPSAEPAAHPAWASVQPEPAAALPAARRRRRRGDDGPSNASVDLPDVAWISARDATRAPGDLEDQAARYHRARHELTINADFRAITDLSRTGERYRGVPAPTRDRGAGPGMVRTDPGRGGARRPQLALERGAARRTSVAELVRRRPAATAPAAARCRSARSEARDGAERSCANPRPTRARRSRLTPDRAGTEVRRGAAKERRRE